jgi:hypothetical protein
VRSGSGYTGCVFFQTLNGIFLLFASDTEIENDRRISVPTHLMAKRSVPPGEKLFYLLGGIPTNKKVRTAR